MRGKGKSGFIVLRQRTETVQVGPCAYMPLIQPHPEHKGGPSCAGGRDPLCAAQAVLFVDDTTVSKGMVKYASAIPRESILDISGEVSVPETPVAGCSCSQVRAGSSHSLQPLLSNAYASCA